MHHQQQLFQLQIILMMHHQIILWYVFQLLTPCHCFMLISLVFVKAHCGFYDLPWPPYQLPHRLPQPPLLHLTNQATRSYQDNRHEYKKELPIPNYINKN